MSLYHYAIMDYSGFIKLGTIQAASMDEAFDHLDGSDLAVMVSEKKIPIYNNKTLLSTHESSDA